MESLNVESVDGSAEAGKRRFASVMKVLLVGCGSVALLGVGACVAGAWYVGNAGKKAIESFQASRKDGPRNMGVDR